MWSTRLKLHVLLEEDTWNKYAKVWWQKWWLSNLLHWNIFNLYNRIIKKQSLILQLTFSKLNIYDIYINMCVCVIFHHLYLCSDLELLAFSLLACSGAISLAPKSMNWWSPNDHCWMFVETTEKCLVFGFSHQLTYPPNELQLPSLLSTVLVPMLSSLADTFSLQIKAHCPCYIWKCQILQLTSVNKLINPL